MEQVAREEKPRIGNKYEKTTVVALLPYCVNIDEVLTLSKS